MAKKAPSQLAALLAQETIQPVDFVTKIEENALTYSLMTIIARALPDIRDGMKPVQRRILYSMWTQGLLPTRPHRKSAGVTGDVAKWLHPHGSAYDALCNLVNDFEIRYPLIDGQGNFGSVDGDIAAAERYTECRLTPLALLMLQDIDKYLIDEQGQYVQGVVDFKLNFAEEHWEPVYLPAALPYLLLNGSRGIAVGYTTDIPSHNLTEVCDALLYVLGSAKPTLTGVLQYIQGPDLPVGCQLHADDNILKLYETGKATLRYRAHMHLEEHPESGNQQWVITDLPPAADKVTLIKKLYELCLERKDIGRVVDIRDESEGKRDESGVAHNLVRLVVEMHRTATPALVMQDLYKLTTLESTYSYVMRTIIDKTPTLVTLLQLLESFLEIRRETVLRRTHHDLLKLNERLHLQQGKHVALQHIDEVIRIIRQEDDPNTVLRQTFALSQLQVDAIVAMPLRALRKLEAAKLVAELAQLEEQARTWETILHEPKALDDVIAKELRAIKKTYGDARKTELIDPSQLVATVQEELVQANMVFVLTPKAVHNLPAEAYDKLVQQGTLRWKQEVCHQAVEAIPGQDYLVVNAEGTCVRLSFAQLLQGQGLPPAPLLALYPCVAEGVLIAWTPDGLVKKTTVGSLKAKHGKAVRLMACETLGGVVWSSGAEDNTLVLATRLGLVHRFYERAFVATGADKPGVPGIVLQEGDTVVGCRVATAVTTQVTLWTAHDDGTHGYKTMALTDFPVKGRVAKGLLGVQFSKRQPGHVLGLSLNADGATPSWYDAKGLVTHVTPGQVDRYAKPIPLTGNPHGW